MSDDVGAILVDPATETDEIYILPKVTGKKSLWKIFKFLGWDRCSWKGQLEKTRKWKVLSWKVRNEIGKIEVGEFAAKLESSSQLPFPTTRIPYIMTSLSFGFLVT